MKNVVVIGGGPAGLMACEVLGAAGLAVQVYDSMPSVGRKFLLAGIGGLNLTHSEAAQPFASRFAARHAEISPLLEDFGPTQLRDWAHGLGVQTFVGSSGRVFPADMKSAPLLRAWLRRLRHPAYGAPVQFHMRHRWTGFAEGDSARIGLDFDTPAGPRRVLADVVVLALGGASWARLGSDGAWVTPLLAQGVAVAPLLPANCGFDVLGGWSPHFAARFAGVPFKSVALSCTGVSGESFQRKGEFVATATGVEGSLIYAASRLLREAIAAHGEATFAVDLLPALPPQRVLSEVAHARGSRSLSSHLKSRLGLDGIKAGLLVEVLGHEQMRDPARLAASIKALPIYLSAARPIDEAISSAGGVSFECLDQHLMVRQRPGLFCAGEMLDWKAPTGGYLMTASMASGRAAGNGAVAWLSSQRDGQLAPAG